MTRRAALLESLADRTAGFDLAIIGGGANGAGIALDAASRGLRTVLFERAEFGSGTSSRSSKLIHGGVRYLGLGQWGLVREALAEQALLLRNAPTLVRPLRFMLPAYGWFDAGKFYAGLKCYDALASGRGKPASNWLAREAFITQAPTLRSEGLRGGVVYEDAAFDDAQLIQTLLSTARNHGATTLNYAEVCGFERSAGQHLNGLVVRDTHGAHGGEYRVRARVIINATGAGGDSLRRLDDPDARAMLSPSQGAHIVVASRFGAGPRALVLPRTRDGRIMFAIPWHDRLLLGTTDTAVAATTTMPRPLAAEIDAILDVAADFLDPAPTRADILSTFAGLRPLVGADDGAASSRRSREHGFAISPSGLVSVSGGKWTTYRLIAAQCVDFALNHHDIQAAPSMTASLPLVPPSASATDPAGQAMRALLAEHPGLAVPVHPTLPDRGVDFAYAARHACCVSVADALSFHSRAMFIDTTVARAMAPQVAAIMAPEIGGDADWQAREVANVNRVAALYEA